mgnify:CR=1 FL=1
MTKASKKKSSGSKYAVLILTAVIAIIAIGCGLFYATSNSKKDVLDKKGDEPQTVSLLDESIEAQRLLDNILLQKNNWQLIENNHGKKDVEVEESGAKVQINQRELAVGVPSGTALPVPATGCRQRLSRPDWFISVASLPNIKNGMPIRLKLVLRLRPVQAARAL